MSDVAQLVEVGSPTRDDQGSIPGVAIDSFSTISGRDDVPRVEGSPSDPSQPTTVDQTDNEVDGEMDTSELVTISTPEDYMFLSSGSIEPGQRPRDSPEVSHVSETQLSLGIPLGTLPTPTQDKTLKAIEAIRKNSRIATNPNPTLNPAPKLK